VCSCVCVYLYVFVVCIFVCLCVWACLCVCGHACVCVCVWINQKNAHRRFIIQRGHEHTRTGNWKPARARRNRIPAPPQGQQTLRHEVTQAWGAQVCLCLCVCWFVWVEVFLFIHRLRFTPMRRSLVFSNACCVSRPTCVYLCVKKFVAVGWTRTTSSLTSTLLFIQVNPTTARFRSDPVNQSGVRE